VKIVPRKVSREQFSQSDVFPIEAQFTLTVADMKTRMERFWSIVQILAALTGGAAALNITINTHRSPAHETLKAGAPVVPNTSGKSCASQPSNKSFCNPSAQ